MKEKSHTFLVNAPTLLNDARSHISSSSEHNRHAMYAVTASISAMEAFLNELAQYGEGYRMHGLTDPLVRMSACIILAEENRISIPKKFICAYEALLNNKFDKGSCRPYQKFLLAIEVRNQLAHPKASVLDIGPDGIHAPKNEQKLVKKLVSNGFKINKTLTYDWHNIVNSKDFALWVYQGVLDCMNMFFDAWPHENAIAPYKQMYSTTLYSPEQWESLA